MQKAVCTVAAIILATTIVCVFALIPHTNSNDTGHSEENSLSEEADLSESQIEDSSKNEIVLESTTKETEVLTTSISVVASTTTTFLKETTETEYSNTSGYAVPYGKGSFKSYTNYRLLSKSSPQWTKVQCDDNAYTDENGLRKVGDYYCVAMGSYYSRTLGDLFEIQTTGGSFKVIICDFKSDRHTDSRNQYTLANNCVVEFYVDTSILSSVAKQMGDISYVDDNFRGQIVGITKLGNYFS